MFEKNLASLDHFSRLQASGADAQALGCALDYRSDGTKIHVPAALAHVVGVADSVSESRPLAADCAYLCHFN